MSAPRVSVVLPVYNGADLVGDAIDSILNQTFRDFELIIIDDGSTDNTASIVASYSDPRIRFFRQPNIGLAPTLNRGLDLARGVYIARQDHDDISEPTRFEKQVAYMDQHPDCALLGTRAVIQSMDGTPAGFHDHPVRELLIRFELLFDCPFVHSTVMIRKTAIEAVGGYINENKRIPEDYELWSRIAERFPIANLPERLLVYRATPAGISRVDPAFEQTILISANNLARAAGLPPGTADATNLSALCRGQYHLVTGKPKYSDLSRVLNLAVAEIEGGVHNAEVRKLAAERLTRVRINWAFYRFPVLRFLRPGMRRMNRVFTSVRVSFSRPNFSK